MYLYLFTDRSILERNLLTGFRILLFVASNVFVCWISLAVINQRLKDRKMEEAEIIEMMSMQKRSEDFLANVSHELRTPINAVLGIGSVIRQQAAGTAEEDLPEMDAEELQELYEAIAEFAEIYDADGIGKMLQQTEGYAVPEVERERFAKVKAAAASSDWNALKAVLGE